MRRSKHKHNERERANEIDGEKEREREKYISKDSAQIKRDDEDDDDVDKQIRMLCLKIVSRNSTEPQHCEERSQNKEKRNLSFVIKSKQKPHTYLESWQVL